MTVVIVKILLTVALVGVAVLVARVAWPRRKSDEDL